MKNRKLAISVSMRMRTAIATPIMKVEEMEALSEVVMGRAVWSDVVWAWGIELMGVARLFSAGSWIGENTYDLGLGSFGNWCLLRLSYFLEKRSKQCVSVYLS